MDNEYLIDKISKILKDRENSLFTGTISNPKLFSECNVTRDSDKLSITAINLNCISPGKVIVIKDIDDNKYYCFTEIENNVASTKNILYRKTLPNEDIKYNYYLELLDLNDRLDGKTIEIGKKRIICNKNKKIKKIKELKNNKLVDLEENKTKIQADHNIIEWKGYLICYSDSCNTYTTTINNTTVSDTKQYNSFINSSDNKYKLESNINNQPIKKIKANTKFYVTNFTPFTLFSFISNKYTKPNTDLSIYFTTPVEILKRDKKKYNPNFYYVWRLIEAGDGFITYAYGWVNLDGMLKVVAYDYEKDPGCKLNTNYVFHSENDYDGHMRIDIGGMDRTSLIINNRTSIYVTPQQNSPSVIFSPATYPNALNGYGRADINELQIIINVNNAINDPID